ncbi:MAG: hypothetical protein C0501_09720 [Isosphaera sp.]|nr:hypothetical protein [Isosphaera sp.]
MRSAVLAAAVLSSAGLSAQDKKYESKEGKYAVAFPGAPETDSDKVGDLTLHTATAEGKGVVFVVTWSDLPGGAGAKPADVLGTGEKTLAAGLGAKGVKAKDVTFGPDKLPARELAGEAVVGAVTKQLRATLIVSGGRLYQVVAIGTKEAVTGRAGDAFFESFEVRK